MNTQDIRYRHEWKHEITYADMLDIRLRLKAFASFDPHAAGGHYHIRSLYFDNMADKALKEKTDGVNRREKFRIRYYNGDTSFINLEKKSKTGGLGSKYSSKLSYEQSMDIISGETEWMKDAHDPLIQELYLKMTYQGLRPKTIVDYEREPYIYAPGNVRVTFDYDIRTGLGSTDFLDPNVPMIAAGSDPPIILEVKWDEYLPDIIKAAVQTPGRRVCAFSKYAQSRVYG